jgi:menaquinone-dependent protoporphyrinogen oxidase
MRVLITYATRHGSTTGIAEALGAEMVNAGLDVDVRPMAEVDRLGDYQAVVLGSAVYVGRWLPEAVSFIEERAVTLAERPVWLFSSGPVGEPEPKPAGDPEGVAELVDLISARDHRVFAGKIDRAELSFGEKVIVSVVRAPEGDFRDFSAIATYAREIVAEVAALPVDNSPPG